MNAPDSDEERERIKAVEIYFMCVDIPVEPVSEICLPSDWELEQREEWQLTLVRTLRYGKPNVSVMLPFISAGSTRYNL